MAVIAEFRLEKRPQHLCDGLLDQAIQNRRDSQRALGPIGLRTASAAIAALPNAKPDRRARHRRDNPRPSDGRGPVVSFPDRNGDPRPVFLLESRKFLDGHAVDPRLALVPLHALPRRGEVCRFKDLLDHGSFLRGSMLPSAMALGFASPSGVVGWSVRHGVDPLLIGSVLHRLNAMAAIAARLKAKPARMDGEQRSQSSGIVVCTGIAPPARFPDYYDLC